MSTPQRCQRFVILLALAFAAAEAPAQALAANDPQDPWAPGAAAYAAGNHTQALALLAEAIRSDPHDPRPYYLRAICLARTGQPVEARADLVVAAALEARQPERYQVDDALAQLPAPDRTLVNQFRWRAQDDDFARAFDAGLIAFAERPLPTVRTDAAVLRQKTSVPLAALTKPMTLAELTEAARVHPAAVAVESGSNPFYDDSALPELLPAQSTPAATAAGDPFGESEFTASANDDRADAPAEPADPFAGDEAEVHGATDGGKISSTKLMGILGRAFARAAPLPAVGRVRDQLPDLPLPIPGAQPAAGDFEAPHADHNADPFGAVVQPAAFDEESDFRVGAEPFDDETQPQADELPQGMQQPAADDSEPAQNTDEDPFG